MESIEKGTTKMTGYATFARLDGSTVCKAIRYYDEEEAVNWVFDTLARTDEVASASLVCFTRLFKFERDELGDFYSYEIAGTIEQQG